MGDIAQITIGQSPDGSTYTEEPSDYILIQGNADLQDGWVKPRVWTTQKTKTCNAGDLIVSVRAPAGAMGKTAYDVVIGRGVAAIKGNEFVYQTLVKMDSDGYWKKLAAGSAFESINSDSVINAEIMIPSEQEQRQIGTFFSNLDTLITLHPLKFPFGYRKMLIVIQHFLIDRFKTGRTSDFHFLSFRRCLISALTVFGLLLSIQIFPFQNHNSELTLHCLRSVSTLFQIST